MARVLLVLALCLPAAAFAQPGRGLGPEQPPRSTQARSAFEEGREAFDARRYAEAVELWNRAYALHPHPILLINIGNAWTQLRNPERARSAYQLYLQTAPPEAEERRAVEAWMGALGSSEPSGATNPWTDPFVGRTFTWIAGGAGLVSLAVGVGLYLDAQGRFDGMMATCATNGGCPDDDVDGLASTLTASHVAFTVGALALAAAVTLWIVEGATYEDEAPEVVVGPHGVGARF